MKKQKLKKKKQKKKTIGEKKRDHDCFLTSVVCACVRGGLCVCVLPVPNFGLETGESFIIFFFNFKMRHWQTSKANLFLFFFFAFVININIAYHAFFILTC